MTLEQKIFEAGVVGAGGAGFPSHIKARSKVDTVLANGAECEPLLHKDVELMKNHAPEIVNGFNLMLRETGAKKGYFGIKSKNSEAIEAIENEIAGTSIEMSFLGDFYPSGDEYELVYEATNRLIPPHGIPLDVGCVVNNVETLYNIYNAENGIPVTKKIVTITGAVHNPITFWAPIGISFRKLIEIAGGPSVDEFGIFVSGLMMGKLSFDLDDVVTKTTAGLIILPKSHYLINRMERPITDMNRIGKSACDQCSYCTEFCPRYLLGYDVQPHKVMRSLVFTTSGDAVWNKYADLCCACGICSLYACPEDLYPREACVQGKSELAKRGEKYEQSKTVKVHPIKEGRRVPLKQLMKKLDVSNYNVPTPFTEVEHFPEKVKIPLKQHVGSPAEPCVTVGQKVEIGTCIGDLSTSKLGARIHSSINGRIEEITKEFIVIKE